MHEARTQPRWSRSVSEPREVVKPRGSDSPRSRASRVGLARLTTCPTANGSSNHVSLQLVSKFLKYLLICFSPSGEERSCQGLRMASPSVPMVKKIIESKWSMQRLTG